MNRVLANLCTTRFSQHRAFPKSVLDTIEAAIRASENIHAGELSFAVETALNPLDLLRGASAHERAVEVFSRLRIWDTEANNGVLVYVLLAERDIEIVADRGYNSLVGTAQWEAICREMEAAFAQREFEAGSLQGIRRITALIARHFPPQVDDRNELPDKPTIL